MLFNAFRDLWELSLLRVALMLTLTYAAASLVLRAWSYFAQRPKPAPIEVATADPQIMVTLIHGTWAQNASWTLPGSSFRLQLKQALGDRVSYKIFKWSGRNTFSARELASKELQTHLAAVRADHPNAHHYIVAHSHGGNVALGTISQNRPNANGVVTLSTPFFEISNRPNYFRIDPISTAFAILSFILSLLLCNSLMSISVAPNAILFAVAIVAIAAYSAVALLVDKWGEAIVQKIKTPDFDEKRLLVIRQHGDEASVAIGLASAAVRITSALTTVSRLVLSEAERIVDLIERKKDFSAICAAAGLILSLVGYTVFPNSGIGTAMLAGGAILFVGITGIFLMRFFLAPLAILLEVLFFPIYAVSAALLCLSMGPEAILAMTSTTISAEASPSPRCTVLQLPASAAKEVAMESPSVDFRLMHSSYNNQDAILAIANWINEMVGKDASSQPAG